MGCVVALVQPEATYQSILMLIFFLHRQAEQVRYAFSDLWAELFQNYKDFIIKQTSTAKPIEPALNDISGMFDVKGFVNSAKNNQVQVGLVSVFFVLDSTLWTKTLERFGLLDRMLLVHILISLLFSYLFRV